MVDFGITIIEKIFIFYGCSCVRANSVLLAPKFKFNNILTIWLFTVFANFIF